MTDRLIFSPAYADKYNFSNIKAPESEWGFFSITNIPAQSPIYALWINGKKDGPAVQSGKTVFYLHGNNTCMDKSGVNAGNLFYDAGIDFFTIEYRGYGQSGDFFPTEESIYSDAEAGLRYLKTEKGIDTTDIIMTGHSLGCAPSVEMAVRHRFYKVMLISPFTSVNDAVQDLTHSLAQKNWYTDVIFDNFSKIKQIKSPLIFIHGLNDDLLPCVFSKVMYAFANEPKEILIITNCGHPDSEIFYKIGKYHMKDLVYLLTNKM